jgi:hypothetical protein
MIRLSELDIVNAIRNADNAVEAIRILREHTEKNYKYKMGDRVQKISGGNWHGHVVGFYSTSLTPIGYAIESEREEGSVQLYPEKAIEII